MTKDEVRNMMKYFQAAYKGFYEGANLSDVLHVWCNAFKDVDKYEAQIAARNYVQTNEYPPTIAGVMQQVKLIREPEADTELWALIVRAAKNSTYGAAEEFDRLPPVCQRFLGSPTALRDLGQVDPGTLQTVVKGQFVKTAPRIREHNEVQTGLPAEVHAVIADAKARLLEADSEAF